MTRPAKWTNRSVLGLGLASDPVATVTALAREVVSKALDNGWSGPPFDPLALAEILKIPVSPSDEVRDARTVSVGESGRVRIEFNPNRPPARVRFSIAHEIGHTLFPDCAKHVRNRAAYHELTADGWQLEALCNIAAAELLMPAGSLPVVDTSQVNAELIMEWRRMYDVSIEALLIRITHLASSPCAMFCASPASTQLDNASDRYHVDYAIGSAAWDTGSLTGVALPASSLVSECASVGFTANGDEHWDRAGEVHVECIAVAPYPGAVQPRVVGLLRRKEKLADRSETVLFGVVRGDATRPRGEGLRIIAHVVNDATPNWGGGGFASALRRRFDDAQTAFREWIKEDSDRLHLGAMHVAEVGRNVQVATLIAQKGYGQSARPRLRYSALRRALDELGQYAARSRASVHVPRIGAGQARGQWSVIEGLMREYISARGVPVTVYDLPGAVPPPAAPQTSLEL